MAGSGHLYKTIRITSLWFTKLCTAHREPTCKEITHVTHSMFRCKLIRPLQSSQLMSRDAVLIVLFSAYMGSNEIKTIALCTDYCPYKDNNQHKEEKGWNGTCFSATI